MANKNYTENYSRRIFDPATGDTEDLQTGYNCVTGKRAAELLMMAMAGEVPGCTYSDYEVSVWSRFYRILNNGRR